jgi:hypothetical protein
MVSVLEKFQVSVDKLKLDLEAASEALNEAMSKNERVEAIYTSLSCSGCSDSTIETALEAEFGKPKKATRKRVPKLNSDEPTEAERKVLNVLTDEPMTRKNIIDATGGIGDEPGLLSKMQLAGLVKNVGGKGRGAGWVLTSMGARFT